MSRHDRLLHILALLRSRRGVTIAELAGECGVAPRTIYRDIDTIARANYPIYYDRGYRLLPTAVLPPPQFTAEEQAVLRAALDAWPLAGTSAYRATLRRLRAKLDSWLPGGPARSPGPVVRPPVGADAGSDPQLFSAIIGAIAACRSVDLEYDSLGSGLTRRRVEPYFLVFRGRAYYMVAFCHRARDFRLFRLGRIRSLAPTTQVFRRDPGVSLERLFHHSWEVYLGTPFEATVVFRGRAARVIAGRQRHPDERLTAGSGGTLRYTVKVTSVEEFGRWLLGFGGEAKAVSPPELVRWISTQARDILAVYR